MNSKLLLFPVLKSLQEFEDTKEVIRICKLKDTMARRKQDTGTNNDQQNITHKTKNRATRTSLKTRGELVCSGRESNPCPTSGTRLVTLVTNLMIRHQ